MNSWFCETKLSQWHGTFQNFPINQFFWSEYLSFVISQPIWWHATILINGRWCNHHGFEISPIYISYSVGGSKHPPMSHIHSVDPKSNLSFNFLQYLNMFFKFILVGCKWICDYSDSFFTCFFVFFFFEWLWYQKSMYPLIKMVFTF